jgi:hypothetical protein
VSVVQWFVIALIACSFIAMVTAFAVTGWGEVQQGTPQGDSDFPPLDYRQYRKI